MSLTCCHRTLRYVKYNVFRRAWLYGFGSAPRSNSCESFRRYLHRSNRHFFPEDYREPSQNDTLNSSSTLQDAPIEAPKPWYLQENVIVPQENPILDRQKLPDLPSNAPELLAKFVDYISHDLGLDDLSILDLRDVEPPPALGPDLIMVIGTARSEKHLHVSAERFRRWLKTDHGRKATTDGLIGRGELKLKLRRKMRRAKLLSRTGTADTTPIDDGIRTGWICVTVRDVGDESTPEIHQDDHLDYVGFGVERSKVTVIIQMLTQSKRDELDLEYLWSKEESQSSESNGRRHSRSPIHLSDSNNQLSSVVTTAHNPLSRANLRRATAQGSGQLRWYHSSGTSILAQRHSASRWASTFGPYFSSPSFCPRACVSDQRPLMRRQISTSRSCNANSGGEVSVASSTPATVQLASSLGIEVVRQMSLADARTLLHCDAPLWESLKRQQPLFPRATDYQTLLEWHVHAGQIGLLDHKPAIIQTLQRMQAIFIFEGQAMETGIITSLLQPPVSESDILSLASVVQSAMTRDHELSLEDIRQNMQDTILAHVSEASRQTIASSAYHRLRRLFNQFSAYAGLHEDIRSIYQCAHLDLWDEIWRIWREYPTTMRYRPKELYCALLNCAASRNHQAMAIDCLRECIAEMEIEEPAIDIDIDIAQAIKSCLMVAEPNAPYQAADGTSNTEWAKLWRRCDEVTEQSRLELD